MLNNERRTHPLITCLYKTCFNNIGLIGSNIGPFTRNAIARKNLASDNVDLLDLLIIWTAWISRTFRFLGGALGLLAIFFGSSLGEILDL